MLSINDFFGEEKFSWLPSKNKVADEKKMNIAIWWKKNVYLWKYKFPSTTLCLEGSQLIIFTQKYSSKKAAQNNKYDITNTWSILQVCPVTPNSAVPANQLPI